MATKDAVGYLVVAAIAGGGAWYFFKNQIEQLQARIDQLEAMRYAEYGVLSAVNRMQLAVQPAQYKCTHTDRQGLGKGTIRYEWSTEYAYGIDVQNYDWKGNITRVDDHSLTVKVPGLTQLNPVKVEFDEFIETNEAGGNRWERMYRHVVDVAHNWMDKDGKHLPYAKPAIVATARQQLENHLKSLLNAERPLDKQITNLKVEFATRYNNKPAIKFSNACVYS